LIDDTLKQALSVALNQSPFLNVLPENKVTATYNGSTSFDGSSSASLTQTVN
jgi:hypothetical protein